MTIQNCLTSACRYCRFYQPDGLHRGTCQQLNVSVQSDWKACQLALPAFANTWDSTEELKTVARQEDLLPVQSAVTLDRIELQLTASALNVNN